MEESRKRNVDRVARGATLSRASGPNYQMKEKPKKKKSTSSQNVNPESFVVLKPIPDSEKLALVVRYLVSRGIAVDFYKEKYIARRLRVRIGRLGLETYEEYLKYLKSNTMELNQLKESLSINVTRFFRNRDTFDLLKNKIFPQIVKNIDRKEISIWSAGCAVGAEPYSISIIAGEFFKKHNINVRITATDVNEDLISVARSGVYSPPYLAELTDAESRQYFMENTDGNFEVNPIVKSRVHFKRHDLTKDKYPTGFDIIMCRNVLIYIDKDAQMEIISKFIESLRPGGILILGRTETLLTEWRHHVKTLSGIHRIYQKLDGRQLDVVKSPISSIREQVKQKSLARSSRKLPESTKRIAMSSERVQNRLKELKDFRKRFEERKRQWEERMENMKKPRGDAFGSMSRASKPRSRITKSPNSLKRPSNQFSRRTISDNRINNREPIGSRIPKKTKSSRINFREILKPVKTPTRVAKVRKDDPLRKVKDQK